MSSVVPPKGICELDSFSAVSYTHLDVYKRQELEREIRGDVNVRQSSHAIGAEHPRHIVSVQWVIRLV